MKISYKLIQQYINCPLSPEELSEKLTMAGLEVGAVEKKGDDLSRCVVGQIREINPHPQADRLTVCRTDVGTEVLTIVCGARNMKVGDKVPVAQVNCTLPGGFTIKKSKLRGVISEGMMCSEKELGLSEESAGLMILPADAPIGAEIASYLGLGDAVLEVELTPNRGDCLSMRGIVREIAALTGEKPERMEVNPVEEGEDVQDFISIEIKDPDLCPRYAARLISGVTIGPSPVWLVQRLKSLGIRSINNVVDVTNFVMMEWGQPLHAFDYDLIQGKKIIVRRGKENEKIVTLDNVERELTPQNLVIADANRPVAVAGVMGGANTEVSEKTRNILLESAFFTPIQIRRTAQRFGLHSEASHRFERGVDPEGSVWALNRAAQLILDTAGGKAARGVIDVYPAPFSPRTIILRLAVLKDVLGTQVPQEKVVRILQDLDFSVTRIDQKSLDVCVPAFRWDIEREIDLIEEVARIYGYSNIPVSYPSTALSPEQKTKSKDFEAKIRNVLIGLGFYEAINFSFICGQLLNDLPAIDPSLDHGGRVYLKNPLVEGNNVLRTSLLPALLENVAYNQNRQIENIRLFELGACFFPGNNGSLPNEKTMLAMVMQGTRQPRSWRGKSDPLTFFDLKGVVKALMVGLRILDYAISPKDTPWLGSSQAACLKVPTQTVGFFGRVGRDILEYFGIEKEVFALELQVELLKASEKMTLRPIPKYPSVSRDLALIVPEEVTYQEVEQSIWEMDIDILQQIHLFDLYRGEQIPEGKKSMGLSLIYQSLIRTLTDQEVNVIHEKIIDHLSKKFYASLRE
ncbi:MAG: phenylalanine--tRNA ligase subunit beta [bacterium]